MFHLPPWVPDYFPVANARYGRSCLGDDDTISSTDRKSSEGLPGNGKPAVFRIKTTWLFSNQRAQKELYSLTLTCCSNQNLTQFCHWCFVCFTASVHRVTPARFPFHHLRSQHAALRSVLCDEMSLNARWRAFSTDFVLSFPRWSDRSTI